FHLIFHNRFLLGFFPILPATTLYPQSFASGVDDADWSYELEKRVDRSTRYNHVIVQWPVNIGVIS
ncbi:MAG: hypothetical protein OXF20_07465, partial [Gammaproteobacteria bacterium]|nr:hypothetical protein [Gammaproteobacteria bacterium]